MTKNQGEKHEPGAGYALRRVQFREAYLTNGHRGAAAAEVAGYTKGKQAYNAAYRLLTELTASGELGAVAQQRAEAAELDTVRTLRELARIAYADIGKLFDADGVLIPIAELDEDTRAIIASIELGSDGKPKKIKLWSKIEALDKAMRHAGLYERDNDQCRPNLALQVNLVDCPKKPE
jgi:Terminase small subunit